MIESTDTQLEKATLLGLYREMLVIRRCEEQLAKAHQAGLIHGACHTYIGQEAVAVGVCAHLRPCGPRMPCLAPTAATAMRWPRACRRAR
jgi:TPP-dependent pyruvate/acetoin dehydrogenase alpha subunit